MNRFLTFAFIGGDLRQIQAISRFAQDGHTVRTFGLESAELLSHSSIEKSSSLKDCLYGAEIVILPLPYTTCDGEIRSSFSAFPIYTSDVLKQLSEKQLLFAGRVDEQLKTLADLYHIHLIDYAEREELAVLNSIPTAEGALEIAMRETPYTIHGSHSLVLGYGRIGKILASSLKALGAKVSVAARKPHDLAWIAANSLKAIPFPTLAEKIGEFDIIFNTVPSLILDFRLLSAIPDSTLILDLASRPGGIDFETAGLLGKKAIRALSLPGKVAPETAGNIIKNTIENILEELGV